MEKEKIYIKQIKKRYLKRKYQKIIDKKGLKACYVADYSNPNIPKSCFYGSEGYYHEQRKGKNDVYHYAFLLKGSLYINFSKFSKVNEPNFTSLFAHYRI